MSGSSSRIGRIAAAGLLAGAAGLACAQQPVLYPNAHYERVGPEVARLDVERCLQRADGATGLELSRAGRIGRQTAESAAVGAATGAVAGAFSGRPGRGAGLGAAVGATFAFMRGILRLRQPAPIERRFAEICLGDEGYRVIGWQ